LELDQTNEYDCFAIKVIQKVEKEKREMGFIKKELAQWVLPDEYRCYRVPGNPKDRSGKGVFVALVPNNLPNALEEMKNNKEFLSFIQNIHDPKEEQNQS
jgi:hypothetical protein